MVEKYLPKDFDNLKSALEGRSTKQNVEKERNNNVNIFIRIGNTRTQPCF